MARLTAFLPCRAGSQRVPLKNTRPFADRPDGLLGIKLEQLLDCPSLDAIMLSTNDAAVIELAQPWIERSGGRLSIDHRPDHLCSAQTSTDDVCGYVPTVIPDGEVLWTHVTSPFVDAEEYESAIAAWRAARDAGSHDSLMAVTTIHGFIWDENGAVNYDRAVEKWPRTQTLKPMFEVNSAMFLAPVEVYRRTADRVGDRPLLYPVPKAKTVDVDWEEDFALAASLWRARGVMA